MKYLNHKGFTGAYQYNKADDFYQGNIIRKNGDIISYYGNTKKEIQEQFKNSIETYLKLQLEE